MDYEEILRTLDVKEISILFWKMRGYTDSEIGRKFGKLEDWVAKEMTPIYQKLGFPSMAPKAKAAKLREEVLPIVKILTNDDEETLVNWPLDSVKVDKPRRQEVEKPVDKPIDKSRRQYSLNIWYVLILVVLATFIGFFLRPLLQPAETPTPVTVIITATLEIIDTPQPSDAPLKNTVEPAVSPTIGPSNTPPPSDTPIPSPLPTESIAFLDDFADGLDPAWTVASGKPTIANEQLTAAELTLLSVGDATWTDYQVEFDVITGMTTCGKDPSYLGLRSSDVDNLVAYRFDFCNSEFVNIVNGKWNPIPGTFIGNLGFGQNPYHYSLTFVGNKITLRANSNLLLSLIDTDHLAGNVYLRIKPNTFFDNFKVTLLNQ